jgi:hypothetical protein
LMSLFEICCNFGRAPRVSSLVGDEDLHVFTSQICRAGNFNYCLAF